MVSDTYQKQLAELAAFQNGTGTVTPQPAMLQVGLQSSASPAMIGAHHPSTGSPANVASPNLQEIAQVVAAVMKLTQ